MPQRITALALWLGPGAAGTVWIPLQAAVVGGFAALQYAALRQRLAGVSASAASS